MLICYYGTSETNALHSRTSTKTQLFIFHLYKYRNLFLLIDIKSFFLKHLWNHQRPCRFDRVTHARDDTIYNDDITSLLPCNAISTRAINQLQFRGIDNTRKIRSISGRIVKSRIVSCARARTHTVYTSEEYAISWSSDHRKLQLHLKRRLQNETRISVLLLSACSDQLIFTHRHCICWYFFFFFDPE